MKFQVYYLSLGLLINSYSHAKSLNRRIIGGHEVQADQHAYQVLIVLEPLLMSPNSIEYKENPVGSSCSGAVIATDTILTAASCVPVKNPALYTVTGRIDNPRERFLPNFTKLYPTQIIPHEQYDKAKISNDIAIIKVQPNHGLPEIQLDFTSQLEGTSLRLSGWGYDYTGDFPNRMKTLYLNAQSSEYCSRVFGTIYNHEQEVCVTGQQQGANFCFGDSGGPVLSASDMVLGVASYVSKPCSFGVAGIQRVSYHKDWITKHTNIRNVGNQLINSVNPFDQSFFKSTQYSGPQTLSKTDYVFQSSNSYYYKINPYKVNRQGRQATMHLL